MKSLLRAYALASPAVIAGVLAFNTQSMYNRQNLHRNISTNRRSVNNNDSIKQNRNAGKASSISSFAAISNKRIMESSVAICAVGADEQVQMGEDDPYEGIPEETIKEVDSLFAETTYALTANNVTPWSNRKPEKPSQAYLRRFETPEWRKWRVINAYEVATLLAIAGAIINPFIYCDVHNRYLPVVHKPVEKVVIAGGEIFLAVLTRVLRGATVNDRLGSDTYKRMNLSLVLYTILSANLVLRNPLHSLYLGWGTTMKGLGHVPGATNAGALWIVLYTLIGYTGVRGFAKGVRGFGLIDINTGIGPVSDLVKEIYTGALNTAKSLVKISSSTSAGYLLATILTFLNLNSLGMYGAPYLGLAGVSLYTLKDAADRGRLEGGTFMSLNGWLSALSFLAFAFITPKASMCGLGIFCVSLFTGLNFFKAFQSKREKNEKTQSVG
mmetsp:Transcript_13544/g.20641  ORF Transcript_13544/g.20641 Transcript_13544/m.20641 type:complete len:441 (+) Transcript_13544:116-1438(+)|eukprot:CAMPEP_0196815608 /NCGR_PEP_ID=MMETSP1362-20130617/50808_1 /TAXON_ID=163516 /ORGANISM="Leptocylindrus danicus, Strain CCMP1856" /LENGTH=440 /DNA_ID=CAMNT_0042192639 /DNA_START=63 /DNA_END=1385 /DNA_ORIENTATION=+